MRAIALTVLIALSCGVVAAVQTKTSGDGSCNVTLPSGIAQIEQNFHGTKELAFSGPWPDGTVVFKPGGAGFVLPDGSLSMKFGWHRGVRGALTIDGRRLDMAAPRLRSHIPAVYGDIGFQPTSLIFPTPGCWEVTGRVGTASLTFITKVVKIGDGPSR
jgi:hypothetical protein